MPTRSQKSKNTAALEYCLSCGTTLLVGDVKLINGNCVPSLHVSKVIEGTEYAIPYPWDPKKTDVVRVNRVDSHVKQMAEAGLLYPKTFDGFHAARLHAEAFGPIDLEIVDTLLLIRSIQQQ